MEGRKTWQLALLTALSSVILVLLSAGEIRTSRAAAARYGTEHRAGAGEEHSRAAVG